ncbi:hypothetical protein [Streptomyces sp. NPDC049879]|uniref:hypothetical protein n=1 Tax=Streptomyces sp. NPDC049879 TaxID=3365598 RepID=UPI0037908F56
MDTLALANEAAPYVTAAVAAYGTAVLTKTTDGVADATVSLGRRIVQRLWGREEGRAGLEEAIGDLAEAPDDADAQAALRVRLRRALRADPGLAAEVAGLLPAGGTHVSASGDRSVAVGTNHGIVSTGDDATVQR